MKFLPLVGLPIVFAAVFTVAALSLGDTAAASVLTAENETGKAIAAVGCIAAALAFDEGDYLRRAWLWSGVCYVVLLAGDLTGMPAVSTRLSPHVLGAAQAALVVVANVASVIGTWMLARAWSVSGLDEDDAGARSRRRALFGGAIVAALLITGWPLAHDARATLGGDLTAAVSVTSDLGDTLCLALVAPVLQTALAMRGGLLRWPWGLLAASGAAWIVFDASSGLLSAAHVEAGPWLVLSEACRALACACVFSAGWAQRKIVATTAA
jgi:hypothetical protein